MGSRRGLSKGIMEGVRRGWGSRRESKGSRSRGQGHLGGFSVWEIETLRVYNFFMHFDSL